MSEPVDPVSVYAQGFLATFGNDCGKRLHEIATTIGLTVTEVDAESFEGALIRIVGAPKGKIAINTNIREPGRKRFTLAHEIGHYILPTHAQQSVACRSSSIERWTPSMPPAELEANRFAAAILMPQPLVLAHLRKEPSLVQARAITVECQTSLTARRTASLISPPIPSRSSGAPAAGGPGTIAAPSLGGPSSLVRSLPRVLPVIVSKEDPCLGGLRRYQQRRTLYDPYIQTRSEHWLKATLLCVPSV